jgi:hypothetical protein
MSEKTFPISLGQGQGPKATVMIKDAQVSGLHIIFFILPLIEPLNCKQLKYIWVLMRCNIYMLCDLQCFPSSMDFLGSAQTVRKTHQTAAV